MDGGPLMEERDLSGLVVGEFILREQIGKGGYGAVYRAEQLRLERDVVVKVLHEWRGDEVSRVRFLREAKLASLLTHPYAAHVYAAGVDRDEDLLWIAMELVQGVSFAARLAAHGPMSLEQFVPFFERVAEVVESAHELGIVHRDLKPSNIMVIECGGRLIPKLIDFGIAKMPPELAPEPETMRLRVRAPGGQCTPTGPGSQALAASGNGRLTPSGACLGSQFYMALEQWHDAKNVGRAADIYSLGVIACQALTGRLPFTTDTEHFQQDRHALPPSLSLPGVDHVIQTALARSPDDRQKTALEMASQLRRALQRSKREQLRASAQQWDDQGRPPGLLWGPDVLADVEAQLPLEMLSDEERSFVMAGLRRARRLRRFRRAFVVLAAVIAISGLLIAIGGLLYRAEVHTRQVNLEAELAQTQARLAQDVAEAIITRSELEWGRSALLHDEPDARLHLMRAYQRGDHSPSTTFMVDRALQPRLAEQARLASTAGYMWSAAFSPDGRQIVTTDDRAAQIWDARTYRRMFTLFHGDTVYQALYSADGAQLVTAGGDGTVKIWNVANGALVRELRRDGEKLRYFIAALSPDGKLVAAIDTRGDVALVWNALTGAPVIEIHNDGLKSPGIAFSPDGRWLATTGGSDVHVLDTRTWRSALTIRGARIHRLAFDPTSSRLVTGATTGDVALWSVPSGAMIRHLHDPGESIDAVAFSPDGQLVASGSRDGTVQIWRAGSGELQSYLNPRHSKISAVEFGRASRLVLAASADGTVIVAEASKGVPVAVLDGPQSVLVAHFDPDSRRIVGASLDSTTRVWDATPPYHRWSSQPVAASCGLPAEPDRRFIAVGCGDRATRIWDTERGQLVAELPSVTPVAGDFASASPAVSSSGDRAAIARGNTVEVYELPSARLLHTIAHGVPITAVSFAMTGRDVVSGAVDGSLLVTSDAGERSALPAFPGSIDAAGFLPDGRVVATDAQRRLRVYDPGGTVLADLEIPARVRSLRADTTRLVTVPSATSSMASPVLVDLERYRIIAQLEGHVGRVFSARWVAGEQILTASADGTARLWDGATGQLRHVYQGGPRILADATLASAGLVVAGGADGRLWFWDKDSERLLWALHAHASQIVGVHIEGGDIVTRGFTGELSRWTLPSPGQVIRACGDDERCAIVR